MRKTRLFIITFIMAFVLFFIPNISKAAELTYQDDKQEIEWGYELEGNNVVNLRYKTQSKAGAVEIPSEIDSHPVVSLKGSWNEGAFLNCAGITSVKIPNTITIIGQSAFEKCTGLKEITIPNSVTTIGVSAFSGCSGIASVTFENPVKVSSIGRSAFKNCTGIKTLTIPDSVTSIGDAAFSGCSGLKEINLSKNLSKIDETTFSGCSGLTSIKLPESVTTIVGKSYVYGAFYNCSGLTKILIPDSVVSIGKYAFDGCSKLTIYGNEGATSKQYAQDNKIPFELIANWDKAISGSDITAPTVKSIYVTYKSVMNYTKDANKNLYMIPAKAKLTINVEFSETIEASTAPTLTIKFGSGKDISVKNGTVAGNSVTYVYTVSSSDKGIMTAVKLSGGNVKDMAGNAATLSCPALTIQYSSSDYVYANGTATSTSEKESTSTSSKKDTSSSSDKKTSSSSSKNTSSSSSKKDTTTAKGKIPYTGANYSIIFVITIVIIAGIIAKVKYDKLKDI